MRVWPTLCLLVFGGAGRAACRQRLSWARCWGSCCGICPQLRSSWNASARRKRNADLKKPGWLWSSDYGPMGSSLNHIEKNTLYAGPIHRMENHLDLPFSFNIFIHKLAKFYSSIHINWNALNTSSFVTLLSVLHFVLPGRSIETNFFFYKRDLAKKHMLDIVMENKTEEPKQLLCCSRHNLKCPYSQQIAFVFFLVSGGGRSARPSWCSSASLSAQRSSTKC